MLQANDVTTVAVFRRVFWERAGGFHDAGLGVAHVYRGLEALAASWPL